MVFHQPTNTASLDEAESTPLNMMDMLAALKEACPVETEISIQERLEELAKIREEKRPKGRQIKGDVSEFPWFFYECGDRIVPNPKQASQVADRWKYRRVPKSASSVPTSPLIIAPRYVGKALVPTVRERRSKTANMGAAHGAQNGGMRPSVGMHPYNRIEKRAGSARTRNGKGSKPPAHLAGVPAELLVHDPTTPPPKPSGESFVYKPRKSGILKSSPSRSPKSGHKSKAPSPEDVDAAKRHSEKKKSIAEKNIAQKRVRFWLESMPKCEPPVLPAPVMRGYAAFQQASELAAGLASLSIAATCS